MLLAKRKHVKQSFKVVSEHFGLWWLCGRGATKDLRAHQQLVTCNTRRLDADFLGLKITWVKKKNQRKIQPTANM